MVSKNREKKGIKEKTPLIVGTPDKNIPKFCTAINFGLLETNHVVMSFTYNDDPDQPHNLIDRIIVDYDHAKKVVEVLGKLVEKVEKEEK